MAEGRKRVAICAMKQERPQLVWLCVPSEKYMDTSLQAQCTAVHRNEGKMHCSASNAGTFHSNAYTFQIVYFFDTPMHIVTTVHAYSSSASTVHCSALQCNLSLQ